MSREELGTLPAVAATAPPPDGGPVGGRATQSGVPASPASIASIASLASPASLASWAAEVTGRRLSPSRTRRRRIDRRLLTLAIAALLGLGGGWAGDAAWRSAQSTDARLRTAGLSVVVTEAQHTGDSATRLTAELSVHLSNLGLVPVHLIGSELTYDAAAVVSIDPPHVTVPARETRTAVLEVAVGCRSPLPLNLPPLQVRTPDGALMSVVADGAGQVLADLCSAGPDVDHLIRQVGVSRDGTRLKVAVTAASGRTTVLHAIHAGGVPIEVRPLPSTVDGGIRTLWLEPPADCPPTWQRTGLPEDLDVDVEVGANATVRIPVGYALAGWLLDGPCAGNLP